MIRLIEELSLNAWPAPRQMLLDGWVLRFAGGYTRRANSVSVLGRGERAIEGKIAECERAYRREGLPCVFKMTRAAGEELESELAGRGYSRSEAVSVQTLDLAGREFVADLHVRLARDYEANWGDAYAQMNSVRPALRPAMDAILRSIVPERRFAILPADGQPASAGLAVAERGWVGLFDIVTRTDRRRNGFATGVINTLLAWAKEQGAMKAYLQVVTTNSAALPLYARMGFVEAYRYWYRVASQ
ncbi:MAG: GNAT family N-acetyltransferase [Tepidisphaeraceae bacterium]|jgi:GNAT superfamily N-acetyltransferase